MASAIAARTTKRKCFHLRSRNVRPAGPSRHRSGACRYAETFPLKDQLGSYRVLYSQNCVVGLSPVHEADRTPMQTVVRVFPALGIVRREPDEKVSLANRATGHAVLQRADMSGLRLRFTFRF